MSGATKRSEDSAFDETLRKMLSTPPHHKPRTKTGVPIKGEKEKKPAK